MSSTRTREEKTVCSLGVSFALKSGGRNQNKESKLAPTPKGIEEL
jgi:hypothetical protein